MLIAISFVYAEVKQDFYRDGTLKSEISYNANGKMDGIVKMYHRNGQVKKEFAYKNGIPTGIGKAFFKNGKIKSEAIFQDDGSFSAKSYYEFAEGKVLKSTQAYNAKGKRDGILTSYDKVSGKVKSETIYKNGKKVN